MRMRSRGVDIRSVRVGAHEAPGLQIVAFRVGPDARATTAGLDKRGACFTAPVISLFFQQHSIFPQASWSRVEMKSERNKFKVQAH